MGIDQSLSRVPFLGFEIKRTYSYYRNNITYAVTIHTIEGLGIGLLFAEQWRVWGLALLLVAILGHVYAMIKGRPD